MNSKNCSFGWATDNIFQRTPTLDCSSNLIAFWTVTSFLSFIRLLSAIRRYYTWKTQTPSKERPKTRFPYSSIISFSDTLFFLLCCILSGLDIINVYNGFSFAFISLVFIPFVFDLSISLLRLVRLGKKIIPLVAEDVDELNELQKFEKIGSVLFLIQTFSALTSSVLLMIISPIFPEHDLVLAQIGFGLK